jgi:hypothetical protein
VAAPRTDDLPPDLEELVAAVRARASRSASAAEIRSLAEEAGRRAAGQPHTVAEVHRLTDVALGLSRQATALLARLADLTGGGRPDGWA